MIKFSQYSLKRCEKLYILCFSISYMKILWLEYCLENNFNNVMAICLSEI